jgi:hypothetical protein
MVARVCVLFVAAVQTFFTLLVLTSPSKYAGRTLVVFSPGRGIDAGDLPLLVLWAFSMACCLVIWVKAGRR